MRYTFRAMVLPKTLMKVSAMALVMAFVGCAGTLTPEERARIGAVRVHPPAETKASLYSDATSRNASMVGAQFGLIGGLVGGSIAAVSIDKGRKRFATVTEPHRPYVATVLRAKMEDGLKQTGKLPLVSGTAPGGGVRFDRIQYGVAHAGEQRFSAIISGEVQVYEPNGAEVWHKLATGGSEVTFTLDEAKANPRVFQTAIEDAATKFTDAALRDL